MRFDTAHQVRSFLKARGITRKFSVRWADSPFSGGEGLFWVEFKDLKGTIVYSSDGGGTHFGNVPEEIKLLADVKEMLKDTNARVG